MKSAAGGRKPGKAEPSSGSKAGFSDFERDAMRERAQELKAEARRGTDRAEGERAVAAAIAALPPPDRTLAERVDALIKAHAPGLAPKTWYGMPAYAMGGQVVCFFQSAHKFKARYATLGFSDKANLDDGAMWPTSFALKHLGPAEETRIVALLKMALRTNPQSGE